MTSMQEQWKQRVDGDRIIDLATDAYFAGHINAYEFDAYKEVYGPDYASMFRGIAAYQHRQWVNEQPWYSRWVHRLLDRIGRT